MVELAAKTGFKRNLTGCAAGAKFYSDKKRLVNFTGIPEEKLSGLFFLP